MSEEKSVIIGKNVTIGEDVIINEEKESIKTKMCTICKEELPIDRFYKNLRLKSGLKSECKSCKAYCQKLSFEKKSIEEQNLIKQKNNEWHRLHYAKTKAVRNLQIKCYRQKNSEKISKQKREYRRLNKEKIKIRNKKYVQVNQEKISSRRKQRSLDPQFRKTRLRYLQQRAKNNPLVRLKNSISALVYYGLSKCGISKNSSTWKFLSYSPLELREHIESLWEPWMNWDNYGRFSSEKRTWQIDHIIPCAALPFDSLDHPNFQKCWALENLRPLEAGANVSKNSIYKGKRRYFDTSENSK